MRARRVPRSSVRAAMLAALAACALAALACGDPPDKEIQQAQGAIDTARAAGAAVYAHDEFTAAEDALRHANEAVAQRDYRLALNNALDARERAQNAAKEAGDRKAAARADAERAMTEATAALTEARARLKAAEAARVPARVLTEQRHVVAGVEQSLQKARASIQSGDYLGALETAKAGMSKLQAVAKTLEAATAGPVRRRR
jgi:uncharacterized protein DUF4398